MLIEYLISVAIFVAAMIIMIRLGLSHHESTRKEGDEKFDNITVKELMDLQEKDIDKYLDYVKRNNTRTNI